MRGNLSKLVSFFANIIGIKNLRTTIRGVNGKSDPNGLCLSEQIEAQICGIKMAVRNTEDGIEMLKKADESLCNVQKILHKMNELAVRSANGTYSREQREEENKNFQGYKEQINHIGIKSLYNGVPIFDPSRNPNIDNIDYTMKLQIGADSKETIMIRIDPMNISIIGLADSNLATQEGARKSIDDVRNTIDMISKRRIVLSNTQNKLIHVIENQNIMIKDLLSAKTKVNNNKDVSIRNELKNNLNVNSNYNRNVIPLTKEKGIK